MLIYIIFFELSVFICSADTFSRLINPKYYYVVASTKSSDTAAMVDMKDISTLTSPAVDEGSGESILKGQQQNIVGMNEGLINMVSGFSLVADRGCHFIVAGRVASILSPITQIHVAGDATNREASAGCHFENNRNEVEQKPFETMHSIMQQHSDIVSLFPSTVANMFIGLSESDFRLDLSSTEIRRGVRATSKER